MTGLSRSTFAGLPVVAFRHEGLRMPLSDAVALARTVAVAVAVVPS